MSTWRKVCCCLAAVAGIAFGAFGGLVVTTGDESLTIGVEGLSANAFVSVELCWGAEDGKGDPDAWANRKVLAVLSAARSSVTVPWPEGWGMDSKYAAVFSYDGVVDDVDTYIQDHLVSQWDTSVGATETKWTDRIGGKTFALVDATLANGRYTFAGSTAYGSLDAESSSALLDNGTNTLEAVFSISGDTYALAGTEKSKIILANWQGQMILSGTGKSTCLPVGSGYSTYSVVYDEVKGDYPPHIARYLNGVATSNGTTYWSIGGTQLWLARSFNNNDSGGTVVFCALRIYDRQLTADEVAINAAIDGARFRGVGAATKVADSLLIEYGMGVTAEVTLSGVNCTVEGAGKYSVGELVTVRAVPVERTKFVRWDGELPAGCSATANELQFVLTGPVTLRAVCGRATSVDAINKDGDGNPISAVLSFSASDMLDTLFCAYGETDGGDDLNAWNHVENVRAILPSETSIVVPFPSGWGEASGPKFLRYFFRAGAEARSVAKNGLAAIWDGIDNVATGAHADETSQWIDLVAGRPIDLVGATIGEKTVGFAGKKEFYGALTKDDAASTFNAPGSVTWECRSVSTTGLEIYGTSGRMFSPWGAAIYTSQSAGSQTFDAGSTFRSYHTVALCYTGSLANNILIDGVVPSSMRTSSQGWGGDGVFYPDGIGIVLGGYSGYPVDCTIQTIRVYTNELSQADAALNAEVDKARFKDGATLGAVESYTVTLTPNTDIRGTFTVRASVPHGTVSGAGKYEQGEPVTLSVAMEEGYTFHRWLGDVPDGVNAYSPKITFTADAHRQIDGFILMPWEAVTDSTGKLVAISNSVWHFAAQVSDGEDGVTLTSSVVSSVGQSEALDKTVDLSTLQRDTGYRLTRLGANVFKGKGRLGSVCLACEDLLEIGDNAFEGSSVTSILPEEVFPNLETVGVFAFQRARRFVAPKVKSIGAEAFEGTALTNFYPTTLAFPLPYKLFYKQRNLRGDFVIDSPSATIPMMLFGTCISVSSLTFNSPVDTVEDWAFYDCSPRAKFYWNVPAPQSLGMCAIGARGSQDAPSKPVPQLICATSKIAEGFKAFADGTTDFSSRVNFVPKEKIDPQFLTKQYRGDASLNRILGWLVSDGGGEGTFRIWVVGPRQDGTLLFIR